MSNKTQTSPLVRLDKRKIRSAMALSDVTVQEIADRLVLSQKTVMCHRANINQKLGARSRADLIRWAAQNGLVDALP